ncbi:sensor histidine kinase [Kibdelosporangium persicum]|uniref:Signal transduction histidine kinase n=1 Tax=Kibdelosporangium persicum TaxID=2698649 RepID=A0ABX2F3R2_9PSEU|nr:ATP-binding protein [Kibdelosporangium persicum]NRN65976.1 Signal transduction histidine kinase [Kibdelosporangium persicum]
MTGPAERELNRLGLFYAVVIRAVVVALCSLISWVTTTPRDVLLTALVIVGFNAWNVFFTVRMLRRRQPWLLAADLAVVAGVCLAQVWTTAPEMQADRVSWVLVATSIIVVAYQFHSSTLVGGVATLVVLAAYLTGGVLAELQDWTFVVPIGSWMVIEAILGRGLYLLVRHGGRAADREFERGEQARRKAAVATARRADEREYLAALHDTASATLLMVGAGVANRPEPWLSEQAARDLEVIEGRTDPADGEVELVLMLRHVVEHVPVRIEWRRQDPAKLPAVVAVALCRGAREALTNVVRHAGVDVAEIAVEHVGGVVRVRIRDHGRGFDPARSGGHGYGVTGSLVERMARLGGQAVVTSAPGQGTEVVLEWPDARA